MAGWKGRDSRMLRTDKEQKKTDTRQKTAAVGGKRTVWLPAVLLIGICVLGMAAVLILNVIVRQSSASRIVTADEAAAMEADCILVLGAGVREDGSPSLMLSDRLDTAVELYRRGVSDRILMSGDHGREDYDEVNVMKRIAVEAGIPSEAVFMDHAGFNTYDSLYRAKEIFQAHKVVIVTQEYHLYRALYLARALGLDAVGVAAPGENYPGQTYRELREMAARAKDFFTAIVKPEASVMGDAIPVSGNGDVTNDR